MFQLNFVIPIILVTILFFVFDTQTYIRSINELTCVWLLMILYGLASRSALNAVLNYT